MQTVSDAFTAEEINSVRQPFGNLLMSWKKHSLLANRTFTIGVSTIGGSDVIGINPGAIGSPGNYQYFDESEYLQALGWEQSLNMPMGGFVKALADAELDNTSGRFTPRYMGGGSELYTSMVNRRPMIINAGLEVEGIDQTLPQFSGILTRPPDIDLRDRTVKLVGADYNDYFQGRYLDQESMYTGVTTDQIMENLLVSQGLSTAQYELDPGINVIPFVILEKGSRYSDILDKLAKAENGHFFQDESGIFRFENRQHWDSAPYNTVSRILPTSQVINVQDPDYDHIVNVVEIESAKFEKQSEQVIYRLDAFDSIELQSGTNEIFVEFENPALSLTTPTTSSSTSYYKCNSKSDGGGSNQSSSVSITRVDRFTNSAKITFSNALSTTTWLTALVITGRLARQTSTIYTRAERSLSVTAYEEQAVEIKDNPYIQDQIWANSLAEMIVEDYSNPENIQKVTIRAMPSLQIGDLLSWQGRYWRLFGKRTVLNPSEGFVQELTLLQRSVNSYFRIGISTIGGSDKIAP